MIVALGLVMVCVGMVGVDHAVKLGLPRLGRTCVYTFLAGLVLVVMGVMP